MTLEPQLSESCLSSFTIDSWFAGALPPEDEQRAATHVDECARCRGRRAELARNREEFLALRPHFDVPSVIRQRTGTPSRLLRPEGKIRGAAWLLAAAASVGLGLALFVVARDDQQPDTAIRTKGGADVGFLVERGGKGERGAFGQVVSPGDRIRFVVRSPAPRYLAILSLDAARVATVYFPPEGAARRLQGGAEAPVDTVVELDGTLGRERLLVVSCSDPFELEPLRKQLQEEGHLRVPAECTVTEEGWVKDRR